MGGDIKKKKRFCSHQFQFITHYFKFIQICLICLPISKYFTYFRCVDKQKNENKI